MRDLNPTRRNYVQGVGALSLLALAGCMESEGESADNGDYMSAEDRENLEFVDREYRIAHSDDVDPKDFTLNQSDWENYPWGIHDLVQGSPTYQLLYEDEWKSVLFEDVEVTSGSVTITIRDDANWSNGEPITGKHVRNHVLRSIFMRVEDPRNELEDPNDAGAPMLLIRSPTGDADWREDAIEVSEKSVTFRTVDGWFGEQAPWTQDAIAREFWNAPPEYPVYDDLFERFLELDDPFGDDFDQVEEIRDSYRNDEIGWEDVPTPGPFYVEEVNGREFTLARNEGHPFAERINWPTVVAEYIEGEQSKRTALVEGHLDASDDISMPDRTLSALPGHITEFRHDVPSGDSFTVHISDDSYFGDVRVRQAIQHVIDREKVTEAVSGETVIEANPVEIPGAMGGIAEVLDDEFLDSLNAYETDTDRAAQLLEDAGFSKEDGTWHTPDGDEWSFRIQTDAQVPHMETLLVDQLQIFGIQAELYTQDSAVLQQNKENGDYDMAPGSWGGELEATLAFFWWIPQNPEQRGIYGIWSDDEVEEWGDEVEQVHIDENGAAHNFLAEHLKDYFTVEAPPVGEPDGDLREYDAAWAAMMLDWGFQLDDYDYEELLKELAWIYNWYVPEFPIHQKKEQKFHNTRDWIVPPSDQERQWYRGSKSMINSGHISADPDGTGS